MLARVTMDRDARDAEHWAAVEEATELLHEERYKEALEALHAIVKADPTNAYAFFFTGQTLYEVGELEPARDAYRACLALAPKHLGARVALCHVLRKTGAIRDAIKEGLIALEQAPDDADVLHAIGLAYVARGETAPARRYLEAFLRAQPEFEVRAEVEAILAALGEDAGGPN